MQGADKTGARGREADRGPGGQDHTRRGSHADARRAEVRRGSGRQEDRTRRRPDGMRRHGCGHPGRGHRGDRQGHTPVGRDATLARSGDPRRSLSQADREEHYHPDAQERGLLDRSRWPDERRGARPAGREAHGGGQCEPRKVPLGRHTACAEGRTSDRGHLRHRRERNN